MAKVLMDQVVAVVAILHGVGRVLVDLVVLTDTTIPTNVFLLKEEPMVEAVVDQTVFQGAVQVLFVLYGPEPPEHSHQLALDRLNFGVENELIH